MPPPLILDPGTLDLERAVFSWDDIQAKNPQRHEFGLLDAVVHFDPETGLAAGYHDIRPDAWWVRGHIPDRPLFPGVLMIEVAAQLASFITQTMMETDRFFGFGGVDDVKFRGAVQPPARFVVIGKPLQMKPRRMICLAQGFVDGTFVFEGKITGMPV